MIKNKPFFSIIIPTLNEEKYISLILNDLKLQSYQDFETILVDGSSTDLTLKKVKQFPNFKPTIITSKLKNVSYQRNLGAVHSQGKYIIFFDADTRIPPYFLEGIKYKFNLYQPDIFSCWLSPDSTNNGDRAIISLINLFQEILQFTPNPQLLGAMMGMKKIVFTKLKGFDSKITYGEDSEFAIRAVNHGFKLRIFRDPEYTFSLRRIRKEGTINMIRKFSKIQLNRLINGWPNKPISDYPMVGGTYYDDIKKDYPIFELHRINQELKKLTLKQRTRLKHLMNYLLDEQ